MQHDSATRHYECLHIVWFRAVCVAAMVGLIGATTLVAGCTHERAEFSLVSSSSDVRFEARAAGAVDGPRSGAVVYADADENTVDIYFTDLPESVWSAWTMGRASPLWTGGGTIGHVHLFLWPRAGRTPIDFAASNATLTLAVIAPDESGRAERVTMTFLALPYSS